MTRYIIIDRNSGYIFGDSADRWWPKDELHPDGPLEAALSLDNALFIDTDGVSYECTSRDDARATYDIYDGADNVTTVWDGQDQATINAVQESCRFITSVSRRRYMDETVID